MDKPARWWQVCWHYFDLFIYGRVLGVYRLEESNYMHNTIQNIEKVSTQKLKFSTIFSSEFPHSKKTVNLCINIQRQSIIKFIELSKKMKYSNIHTNND